MKNYTVTVDDYGSKFWYLNGKLHCEDGPAVEYDNGRKYWYLHGKIYYSLNAWREQIQKTKVTCVDKVYKVIEIDGVKYKLVEA